MVFLLGIRGYDGINSHSALDTPRRTPMVTECDNRWELSVSSSKVGKVTKVMPNLSASTSLIYALWRASPFPCCQPGCGLPPAIQLQATR